MSTEGRGIDTGGQHILYMIPVTLKRDPEFGCRSGRSGENKGVMGVGSFAWKELFPTFELAATRER